VIQGVKMFKKVRKSRTNRNRARNSYIPRFSARERVKEELVCVRV
jgi:hypothetical protein